MTQILDGEQPVLLVGGGCLGYSRGVEGGPAESSFGVLQTS
jgi:hypothetical protein